jgi:capsular exopolysaccharide synthesis family protein
MARREGVSAVASQVALGFAKLKEEPVVLVDANLRHPSLHSRYEMQRAPGFSDVIGRQATIEDAIRHSEIGSLYVLPAGTAVANSLSVLSSAECSDTLRCLRERFRVVIIDTSPIARFADATLVASRADGVVVITAAGRHREAEFRQLERYLNGIGARALGLLLSEGLLPKS